MTRSVLILGGTTEAAALAARLDADAGVEATTSLAGRTTRPRAIAGRVRVGGFGGADGIADYIREEGIDAVVDATHPFAARISAHAAAACASCGIDRVQLLREPWEERGGDRWIRVGSMEEAAAASRSGYGTVLVTTGHGGLATLPSRAGTRYVVRLVEPLSPSLADRGFEVILDRGPFSLDDERRLLEERGIDAIVSKNSGGGGTYGKIAAARELGIPVIMIDPPGPEPGAVVHTVDAACAWLSCRARAD